MAKCKCRFEEFTLTDAVTEVYVDVCVSCGKILGLYTYESDRDDVEYFDEKKDRMVSLAETWQTGANELFIHCPKAKIPFAIHKVFDEICDFKFLLSADDETEEIVQKDILERMVKFYGINGASEITW